MRRTTCFCMGCSNIWCESVHSIINSGSTKHERDPCHQIVLLQFVDYKQTLLAGFDKSRSKTVWQKKEFWKSRMPRLLVRCSLPREVNIWTRMSSFKNVRRHEALEEAKKNAGEQKKNGFVLQKIEEKARQLLRGKSPLNDCTFKRHTKPDIKLLCKLKWIKVGDADSKQKMCGVNILEPWPAVLTPWLEDRQTCHWNKVNLVLQQSKWLLPHPTRWPNLTEMSGISCSNPLPPGRQHSRTGLARSSLQVQKSETGLSDIRI